MDRRTVIATTAVAVLAAFTPKLAGATEPEHPEPTCPVCGGDTTNNNNNNAGGGTGVGVGIGQGGDGGDVNVIFPSPVEQPPRRPRRPRRNRRTRKH